ncbi:MAG: Fe-S cluster assembly ATPase SufC [Bacilli bacterium]|nr:Fe-S cluster assembly ATPase SufC [Bacilli bacterium]
MELLKIDNLHTIASDDESMNILKGLNLTINNGEIHVIMGPNGAGKSTLANTILNSPKYIVKEGNIYFDGQNINELKTNERAKLGIFMSFQSPVEIPGISVSNFIKSALNTREKVQLYEYIKELESTMDELGIDKDKEHRDLNVGFSGGEKKKNEILQMLMLKPKLAILDEIDSGLDIDAIKTVSKGINMYKNDDNAILMITHSSKILEELDNYIVHVLVDGKIVDTGDKSLVKEIEENGYKKYID